MRALESSILLLQITVSCLGQDNWPLEAEKEPQVVSVLEGNNVTLRCAGRFENASAVWEYKPCGEGYNMTLCSEAMSDEHNGWLLAKSLDDEQSATTGRLFLKNVQVRDQGLYRCKQQATAHIQVNSAVRLEVLPKEDDDKDHELPIFLDDLPRNLTTYKDSQADFQCKVLSHTPPRILWVAAGAPGAGSLHYHQDWYSPMTAPAPIGLPGRDLIYVSKMVMPRVRPSDAGRYYCVAINTKGFTNSSAFLEVIGDEGEWTLYLLFLVPLALAAVPAVLWGCFVWRRTRRNRSEIPSKYPLRNSFEIEFL